MRSIIISIILYLLTHITIIYIIVTHLSYTYIYL